MTADDGQPSPSTAWLETYCVPTFGSCVVRSYIVREGRIVWGTLRYSQTFGPCGERDGLSLKTEPTLDAT